MDSIHPIPSRILMKFFLLITKWIFQKTIQSRSHIKAFMVLMRADHYCIQNYIRSLHIFIRPILLVRTGPASYCLCVYRFSILSHTSNTVYVKKTCISSTTFIVSICEAALARYIHHQTHL